MLEALENTIEELKRVDHLFYVSLKYTRTVDMIKHVIERMISTYEQGIDALLKHAKETKMVASIGATTPLRMDEVKKLYPNDPVVQDAVAQLALLMKLRRAKYTSREEYRRHVTMIATIDTGILEVKIDTLAEYYARLKEFVDLVHGKIRGRDN